LAERALGVPERPISVIAAGERWSDGTIRPALEDLLGAGAVIASLVGRGIGPLSPEAIAAHAAYRTFPDVAAAISTCASGRELVGMGYPDDVAVATEIDNSDVVPVLTGESFVAAH
jgi:2-phosphosulfolactate phosphatase